MNGIDRRSQKVRCVEGVVVLDGNTQQRRLLPFSPKVDQVYTVADFLPSLPQLGLEADGPQPGIALLELPCLNMLDGSPVGWPIKCFRPVDERKTDISALVPAKILERA